MATLDDAEQGVCFALAGQMFPGQPYLFGALANVALPASGAPGSPTVSVPAKLYIGAPNTGELEKDIALSRSHVCVQRLPGYSRNATRWLPRHKSVGDASPTLLAGVVGNSVVFDGTGSPGQIVGVTIASVCYAYRVTGSDTAATVAAALAAQIPGATASGNVLAVQDAPAVRVLADQPQLWVTGQAEAVITVTMLAAPILDGPDGYAVRAALSRAVNGLKSLVRPNGRLTRFIGLPDGSSAQITFRAERDDDTPRRNDIWRRWTDFLVMYDEGTPSAATPVLAPLLIAETSARQVLWLSNSASAKSVLTDGRGNILVDPAGTVLGSI